MVVTRVAWNELLLLQKQLNKAVFPGITKERLDTGFSQK